MVEKQIFENETARFEIHAHPDGSVIFWLQSNINGLYLKPDELADVYELLHEYIESFGDEDE